MGYDKDSNSIFNQYFMKVLKEAEESEGPVKPKEVSSSTTGGVEAERQKRAKEISDAAAKGGGVQFRQPGGGYGDQPKSDNSSAQAAGIQPAGMDINTGMSAPYGGPDTMSQLSPSSSTDLVGAARTANQNQAGIDSMIDTLANYDPSKQDNQSTAGMNINTGMGTPYGGPDSMSQLAPSSSTDLVGAARTANQNQSTANSLGLQNYNTDTNAVGSPEKVDIGTGTLAQGKMGAPTTTSKDTTTTAAAQKPAEGPASDKEKELLKKFHASDYNANSQVGQARLAELRQAAAQLGGDLDKIDPAQLANAAYAIQYQKSNPALAAGYAKRANVNPLNPGKPGQPTGGTATAAATPSSSAPASAPSTASATPGVTVPSWRNQPGVNQGQGPTQLNAIKQAAQSAGLTLSDDQLNKFAKAMGIS